MSFESQEEQLSLPDAETDAVEEDVIPPARGTASARYLLDKYGNWETELTALEKEADVGAWTSPAGRCAPIVGINTYESLLALSPALDGDVDLTSSVLRARESARAEAHLAPASVARRLVQVKLLASKRKGASVGGRFKTSSSPSATMISAAWPLMAYLAATRNTIPTPPYGGAHERKTFSRNGGISLTKSPMQAMKKETARWVQRNAVALHADILLVAQGVAHGGGKRGSVLTLFGGVAPPSPQKGASREPDRVLLAILRRPGPPAWSAVVFSVAGSDSEGIDRETFPYATGAQLDRVLGRRGNERLACFFEEAKRIRRGKLRVSGAGQVVSISVDADRAREAREAREE